MKLQTTTVKLILLLAALLFPACATNPITGERIFVLSSPQEDARLGQALFVQLVSRANARGELMRRKESQEAVRLHATIDSVLSRISKAASEYESIPELPWTYVIFKSSLANAGAIPGNRIILWQGIFKIANDEPALAVILGHEVAHVIARHGAQRQAQSDLLKSTASTLRAEVFKGSPQAIETAARLYGLSTQVGGALPFSRSHESEADKMGLILLAKAGYDPREAVRVWERLQREKERRPSEVLSTHPDSETQMKDIEGWLPEALVYYEKAERFNEIVVKSGDTY